MARVLGAVDRPGERRRHGRTVPRLGGPPRPGPRAGAWWRPRAGRGAPPRWAPTPRRRVAAPRRARPLPGRLAPPPRLPGPAARGAWAPAGRGGEIVPARRVSAPCGRDVDAHR